MPFTGDSAKKYKDIITKAKMAVAKANAGQAVTNEKQLAALHELKEQVSGRNSYGVSTNGFQMVRAYIDKANYKAHPFIPGKKVFFPLHPNLI